MSQLTITYLMADGRHRKAQGKILTEMPRHCVNGGDKQAHSLLEHPIIVRGPSIRLERWVQLTGEGETAVLPPAPPIRAEHLEIVCEDNSAYPVSPTPWTDQLAHDKDMADTHAEALILVKAKSARAAYGNPLLKMAFSVLLLLCTVLVLLIIAVVVFAKFGGDGSEAAQTAMQLMGASPW